MAKSAVLLCFLFVASSLCFGKDEVKSATEEKISETSDNRNKRQALKDVFTLYGGWKPILPGSPYYFGTQPFSGGLGGFSYRNSDFGELTSSSYLGHSSFYIPAPAGSVPMKDIYSYYPPPVIGSTHSKDNVPKPLYTERRRRPSSKEQVNQLIPYNLGNIAAIDIKEAAKDLEVLDLRVSVLPLGRGNLKHPIGHPNLQLTPVPIAPQLPRPRPFISLSHRHPPAPRHQIEDIGGKVPVILPTIPVHPKQLPPFQTISELPHRLKHSDLLRAQPLREYYPPQPSSIKSINYRPEKQEEIMVTVVSGNVDTTIQKRPGGSKEDIKVVPIEIPDGALQPAAVIDEVIEIKDVPVDVANAPVTTKSNVNYASSDKRPSVQYLTLNRDQIEKIIKGSGIPIEAELIYSSAENRGILSPPRGANSGSAYKREEVVTLHLKPGQSVEDALLQLASHSKTVETQKKLPIHPSYETVEVIDLPGNDYLFSKRSEKSADVVQRTTSPPQKSTTKTTQKKTTALP